MPRLTLAMIRERLTDAPIATCPRCGTVWTEWGIFQAHMKALGQGAHTSSDDLAETLTIAALGMDAAEAGRGTCGTCDVAMVPTKAAAGAVAHA